MGGVCFVISQVKSKMKSLVTKHTKLFFFQPQTQPQFKPNTSQLILNRSKNAFLETAFFKPQPQKQKQYQTDPKTGPNTPIIKKKSV